MSLEQRVRRLNRGLARRRESHDAAKEGVNFRVGGGWTRAESKSNRKDKLKKLNFNRFVKTKNKREESNNLKEIRGRIVEKGLPPLRNRNIVKSYDYENDYQERNAEVTSSELPWHHPSRSFRANKVVNLVEGPMMQLLACSSTGSGLINDQKNELPRGALNRNFTTRNSSCVDPDDKDKIYIKRHLLKTRGVTAITKSINADTSEAFKRIRQIQKKKSQKDTKKLEKIDLSKMIQKTNKEFNIALYDLRKAMHDMKPKLLLLDTPTEFEVIDAIPTLFKVPLEEVRTPVRILITYLSNVRDLIVYYSWKNPDPDQANHDGAYRNPTKISLRNRNNNTFSRECKAYFSLHSHNGNYVKIIAKSGKERNGNSLNLVKENKEYVAISQKSILDSKLADSMITTIQEMKSSNEAYIPETNMEPKLNNLANDPLHFQAFSMVVDKVKEKMKKRNLNKQGDNFLKKNIALIKRWHEYNYEKRQKAEFTNLNIENAQRKKELILKYKRERKGIMDQEKLKVKEYERQQKKLQNLVHSWALLLAQSKMVSAVNGLFQSKLYMQHLQEQKEFISLRVNFVHHVYLKKRGESLAVRIHREMNRSLTFSNVLVRMKAATAAKTLKTFLENKITIRTFNSKVMMTHMRLTRLAEFCRKNYIENERKRDKLDFIWKIAQGNLISKFSADKSPESRMKEKKLIEFDPDL
ncbi:unnamed protein product [Moneuplotes crassus]|uniref:Uncharacterized protein n=1 Tax=Euplotes crassus TaxID=5936 RepID=A0AAD1XX94_EUPCR|nr:unnamed protein product [Moneuplotes crassus]